MHSNKSTAGGKWRPLHKPQWNSVSKQVCVSTCACKSVSLCVCVCLCMCLRVFGHRDSFRFLPKGGKMRWYGLFGGVGGGSTYLHAKHLAN